MRIRSRVAPYFFVLSILAGCASSKVTEHQPYEGKIDRPDRILVYDFAAAPSDLPPGVDSGQNLSYPPQTPQQLALGRRLGAEIAHDLVSELQGMGLPAVRAVGQPGPRPGDALIVGHFVSVDSGSATKRLAFGFGSGAADLKTVVRGYEMTREGLRALGSGEVEAGSGEMPGGALPLVVTVATANPLGLAVTGAVKGYGEVSGSDTIEGAARRTAQQIAGKIRIRAEQEGWM